MKIGYITNAAATVGVGHRAWQMWKVLNRKYPNNMDEILINGEKGRMLINGGKQQLEIKKWPGVFGSKSINWARLIKKFEGEYDLVHATNQTVSLVAKKYDKSIVTVHDIIEAKEPQNRKAALLNRYLYGGIKEASQIICVSEFTADEVAEFYGVDRSKIEVIYNGVDDEEFYPIPNFGESVASKEWRRELKINDQDKILFYVGSEHPRKNIGVLIEVLAKVIEKYPDTVLVKVGAPGIMSGRENMLKAIEEHKVRDKVRFLKNVPVEKLNELYNLCDALIFPSKYEGFGFPPLEAMAVGKPVITTNATSLPEVTGNDVKYGRKSALVFDPEDAQGMAEAVGKVWNGDAEVTDIVALGKVRAKDFSWNESGEKLARVYKRMLG